MDFVNNWQQPIVLGASTDTAELDLPDGTYRLTIADALGQAATRWEYVDAVVVDATATLTRGLEGIPSRAWPEGSVIYCSLTAGVFGALALQVSELASLVTLQAEQIAELQGRVAALEPKLPAQFVVTVGLGGGSYSAGFYGPNALGVCAPESIEIPTVGSADVRVAVFWNDSPKRFVLSFYAQFDPALVDSVEVQGAGTLLFADSTHGSELVDGNWVTWLEWQVPSTDWFAGAGQERTVVINFA